MCGLFPGQNPAFNPARLIDKGGFLDDNKSLCTRQNYYIIHSKEP